MSRYIDTAEQASMIRKALKRPFPAVKFSVRLQRYAGGSCVNVRWVDGPTQKSVAEIVNLFDGRRFDGMIDLAYYADHYLMPDGSVEFACTWGHSHESEPDRPKPEGAELVHFSGSVSTRRELSPEFEAEIVGEIAAAADMRPDELFRITNGYRHVDGNVRVKVFVDRARPARSGRSRTARSTSPTWFTRPGAFATASPARRRMRATPRSPWRRHEQDLHRRISHPALPRRQDLGP